MVPYCMSLPQEDSRTPPVPAWAVMPWRMRSVKVACGAIWGGLTVISNALAGQTAAHLWQATQPPLYQMRLPLDSRAP